ncbi:phospholipase A and acyltransferase 4-like [Perca fluviatilis]|uniref:phospholipase A and acyltransferase 4-like n=1 Tax=Perca fluviatilis TaxID=8168 RepID=UPI001963CC81|nr:phospholipase A and acyltransferase 4-like [Perca fluviatilis]
MAPTRIDVKPGDLIEISRGIYQHWAIYIGGMEVVHLTTPNSDFWMALDTTGKVKRENIRDVVGNDRFKVNNLLDDKYQPRERDIIVKEACSMVGLKMPYCIVTRNCEHFVTDLRYGIPESRQVIRAAEIGGAALVGVGIVALGAALFASLLKDDSKEESREERREPRRERRRHYNWQQ